jgi:hypothetical protein
MFEFTLEKGRNVTEEEHVVILGSWARRRLPSFVVVAGGMEIV